MVLKTEKSSLLFLIISVCLVFSCLLWILSRQHRFLLESKKTNYNEEESIGNNITKQLNKIDTTPSVNDTTPNVNDTSNFYFYLFIGGIVSCVAVYVYTILRQPKLEPKSILSYSDIDRFGINIHKYQKRRRPIISSSITKFGKEFYPENQGIIIDVFDVDVYVLKTVVSDDVDMYNILQINDGTTELTSRTSTDSQKQQYSTFFSRPPRFCIYLYLPIVQFLHVFVVVFVFVGVTIYYFLQKEEKKRTTITIYTIYAVCVLFVILMTIYRIVHALQIGKTKYLTDSEGNKLTYSFYENDETYSKTVDSPSENSPKYSSIKTYYKVLYDVAPEEYWFISLSHKGVSLAYLDQFYNKNCRDYYEMYVNKNQNIGKSLQDKVNDILNKKMKDYKRPQERPKI